MSAGRRSRGAGRLKAFRAPAERSAEERAWRVVRTVYVQRTPTPRGPTRWRFASAPAALVAAGILALTPAGAAVHRWLAQSLGVRHPSPALLSLPAPGKLLVSGPAGAWTVSADGAKRRLGPWEAASWSPHAVYIAVTHKGELAAVDTRGSVRWVLDRPAVRFPRWFAPSGYRVAYLSATTLRIVAGDGTGDRLLARDVATIPPAWRPGHAYQLAYGAAPERIVVRDTDTGHTQLSQRLTSAPRLLAWSADGTRLLVLTQDVALVLDIKGHQVARVRLSQRDRVFDGALSPDGRRLALLSGSELTLTELRSSATSTRRIFSGRGLRQLTWSPDGNWLLVSWPAADQWIFMRTIGAPRIAAVSHIAEQFSRGAPRHAFPQLDGWCCTSAGTG